MAHTGFAQTNRHFFRHAINVRKSLVDEVLPEHFREDYPMLIEFLDAYYEDIDQYENFGGTIEELVTIRDIEDTKLKYLDYLFAEVGLGVAGGQFTTPREVVRNFGNFFRVKGSEYSIHGFFRAFFNEEVEVFHPKERLFIVGKSNIGTEDAKVIQDGRLYQVFSTLIKGPIPLVVWEALYRKYVHPSGFYLGAAVVIEAEPALNITTVTSIPYINPNINVFDTAKLEIGGQGEIIGALYGFRILPDAGINTETDYTRKYNHADGRDKDADNLDATIYASRGYVADYYVGTGEEVKFRIRDRFNLFRQMSSFGSMTIADLEKYYSSMYELSGFWATFDDKLDATGTTSNGVANSAIKFSSTNDTFDARQLHKYR
jgi:hypothetical protein